MPEAAVRLPRADNRSPAVLDAAAKHFAERGYAGTSMRDIAESAGMLAGSLYYHFPAKEDLLVAVYEAGVAHIAAAASDAASQVTEPWARLEAACVAHLESVLEASDYAQVLIRVQPDDVPSVAVRLRALRDSYENLFRDLLRQIPVADPADRKTVRLVLLGALNWSRFWYQRAGRETPRQIARRFVRLLRHATDRRGKQA